MPIRTHGRNINLCFTKIKWPLMPQSPNSMSPVPQLPDHDYNVHALPPSTTTSPTLIRNFNSLYDHHTFECSTSKSRSMSSNTATSSSYKPDPASTKAEDFASAFASHRFFFSSPGLSNSIVESTIDESNLPYIAKAHLEPPEKLFENSVAVSTYSPDPYADFRHSMQEMVEARVLVDVNSDWGFLHELLRCYLALNPKSTHKFILEAFADLVISLMSQPPAADEENRIAPRSDPYKTAAPMTL